MCLAIPGQVIEFVDAEMQLARVDIAGVRRVIHVGLLLPDGLTVGDWVLIHVGFALSKIDDEEAQRTLLFLQQLMGDELVDELQQIAESRVE
ncbi:MAG: HypC/HybG/HupF family hydrogenase formation chaperone [Longimicrobiales bacterium]